MPVKYHLKKLEALETGLPRVVRALLLKASREAAMSGIPETVRIHTVRKRLKRARAIHKLAWPAPDEAKHCLDQAWLRDLGRSLSQARDVDVLVETHRRLASRNVTDSDADGAEDPVLEELLRLRHEAHLDSPLSGLLHQVAPELIAKAREWDAASWVPIEAHPIRDALTPGIGSYWSALDDVVRSPTGERFHTLRKRVKDLGYQMDFMGRRIAASGKRLRRRADRLSELLGWHHDLWVFQDRLAAMDGMSTVVRDSWERMIETEGRPLEQRALAKADSLRRALARMVGEQKPGQQG
jgi:CHAD domain-containing protein